MKRDCSGVYLEYNLAVQWKQFSASGQSVWCTAAYSSPRNKRKAIKWQHHDIQCTVYDAFISDKTSA